MRPDEFDSLDDFIDAALRDEPIRPTPLGFRCRVDQRVRLLAMARRERRRFRLGALAAATLLLALPCALLAAVSSGILSRVLQTAVPGGLGYYDYWAVQFAQWWPGVVGAAAVATCLIALGTLLLETRAMRRFVHPVH